MNPDEYPRRILLAVTGLSPQVVTETLFALAVRQIPPWEPSEIHLITTREGAQRARLALLSEAPAGFHRLCRDYRLSPIAFDERHIHQLEDDRRQPLADIRTPRENEHCADQITAWVRRFTADPESALHVSIAGGRKTMGYYLGYALSLFGRPQDRLSHVLVNEPFESSWDFFYPTPYSQVIETRDKALADTRDAQVTLAQIPFVRLRHGLDSQLLSGDSSFNQAVAAASASLEPPRLSIDQAGHCLRAGERVVELPPAQLALMSLFARRVLEGKGPLQAPSKEVPERAWADRYLAEYRRIRSGELADIERTEQALARGMDGDYFSSRKSQLHRSLRKALGTHGAAPYLIDDGGARPRRYALKLSAEAIDFADRKPAKPATGDTAPYTGDGINPQEPTQ